MVKMIRARRVAKLAEKQTSGYYFWRPGPGR